MTLPSPQRPLQEKDFIQESYSKNPFPIWLWFFIVISITALLWGGSSWYAEKVEQNVKTSPFLQVTNREFSTFLWQFPEHMRVNAKTKSGYLTGFQYEENKIGPFLNHIGDFVVAPPELIFLYHTWHRLIRGEFTPRAIPLQEFKEFLNYSEEWKPNNWPEAPSPYVKLFDSLSKADAPKDLKDISNEILPREVKEAFQGWKNYFKEGKAINQTHPTYAELQEFLKAHPHYARNFWRNIMAKNTPNYLKSFTLGKFDPKQPIPNEEMTAFLRVALYNYLQSKQGN